MIDMPREVIDNCIMSAGTAPGGTNLQPWLFAVVGNPEIKKKIVLPQKKKKEFSQRHLRNGWML